MKLRDIAGVDCDFDVTGFAIDHRKVARGSVFGAFKGAVFNGEDFIAEAVDRGAVAVVARPEADGRARAAPRRSPSRGACSPSSPRNSTRPIRKPSSR